MAVNICTTSSLSNFEILVCACCWALAGSHADQRKSTAQSTRRLGLMKLILKPPRDSRNSRVKTVPHEPIGMNAAILLRYVISTIRVRQLPLCLRASIDSAALSTRELRLAFRRPSPASDQIPSPSPPETGLPGHGPKNE